MFSPMEAHLEDHICLTPPWSVTVGPMASSHKCLEFLRKSTRDEVVKDLGFQGAVTLKSWKIVGAKRRRLRRRQQRRWRRRRQRRHSNGRTFPESSTVTASGWVLRGTHWAFTYVWKEKQSYSLSPRSVVRELVWGRKKTETSLFNFRLLEFPTKYDRQKKLAPDI